MASAPTAGGVGYGQCCEDLYCQISPEALGRCDQGTKHGGKWQTDTIRDTAQTDCSPLSNDNRLSSATALPPGGATGPGGCNSCCWPRPAASSAAAAAGAASACAAAAGGTSPKRPQVGPAVAVRCSPPTWAMAEASPRSQGRGTIPAKFWKAERVAEWCSRSAVRPGLPRAASAGPSVLASCCCFVRTRSASI